MAKFVTFAMVAMCSSNLKFTNKIILESFWDHLDCVAIVEQGGLLWRDVVVMELERGKSHFWEAGPFVTVFDSTFLIILLTLEYLLGFGKNPYTQRPPTRTSLQPLIKYTDFYF